MFSHAVAHLVLLLMVRFSFTEYFVAVSLESHSMFSWWAQVGGDFPSFWVLLTCNEHYISKYMFINCSGDMNTCEILSEYKYLTSVLLCLFIA